MKKITDLSALTCIHCETQEQWNKILTLDPFNTHVYSDNWLLYNRESVYFPNKNNYCDIEYAQDNGYTIYPASDFLDPEFEYGEKILVGDEQPLTLERTFLAVNLKSLDSPYVTTNDAGRIYAWKYAEKIAAKPIPEYTMEQLMDRVGHEFKIKK